MVAPLVAGLSHKYEAVHQKVHADEVHADEILTTVLDQIYYDLLPSRRGYGGGE